MNYVKVKIQGLNLSRFISKLVTRGVCITDVSVKKKCVIFKISENDLSSLDALCKQEHKYYVTLGANGLRQALRRVPYFFGTVLALVITYVYLFSISLFVFNVNVNYESETEYDLNKVNSFLQAKGIKAGMKKSTLSSSEIQKLLLLNIDDIEGCTVRLSGGNLNITIYPAVKKYEKNISDIKSEYDGIITFAEAYEGKLCVKAGDLVRKGDMLIKSEGGASGKIKAKVYFTSTYIYNENVQDLIFTGRFEVKKDYVILNKFHVNSNKLPKFSNYITKKCSFYLTKNLFIPIVCNETMFLEVEVKNKVVPFEVVEEKVKKDTYAQALSKVPADAEIGTVTYSVVTEKNYTRIDCFIETIIDLI